MKMIISGCQVLEFDNEDIGIITAHTWGLNSSKTSKYAKTSIRKNGVISRPYIHRMLMNDALEQYAKENSLPLNKVFVDHIDRNGLNNRRTNLRVCTRTENNRNSMRSKNKSGFKGVSFDRRKKKFRARIHVAHKVGYKEIFIGYFQTAIEAAKAFNEAALKYHGSFAYLNKLEDSKND